MARKLYEKGTKPPIVRYFCWKLEEKTGGVLSGLLLTGSQDGVYPTLPALFSIKCGTKTHTKQQTVVLTDKMHYETCTVNYSVIIACVILILVEFNGVPTPNLENRVKL